MTAGNLLLVLSAVALAATGQLMLKHGMQLAAARALRLARISRDRGGHDALGAASAWWSSPYPP